MAIVRAVAVILLMMAVVVGGVTLIALETQEVVVLRTRGLDGEMNHTRVWVADAGNAMWIEAGDPEREFYGDIQRDPNVEVERDGEVKPYLATPHPDAVHREKLRAMLRDKYGWADQWVAALFDTARSIAIRLEPRAEKQARVLQPRSTRSIAPRFT